MKEKYQLIVMGGGFSGVAAAISAARKGTSVLLIDKRNCLGGAATGGLVNPFMFFWTHDKKTNEKIYLSTGLFTEICDEMRNFGAGSMPGEGKFNQEYMKLVMQRMVLKAGVDLLFGSYLTGVSVKDGTIESVTVANRSGNMTYHADTYIDATGDGTLAAMAGCPFRLGRDSDHLCQPMTLCFRIANVDIDEFYREREEIGKLYNRFQEEGKIKNPRENILTFRTPVDGVLHMNSTRIIKKDPTDAISITEAEIEAREQVFELFFFLKQNCGAFKNSELLMSADEIGIRESRMIEGDYVLTERDLMDGEIPEDSITVGNYQIDIHNPEGTGTRIYEFPKGHYYGIPYRCLLPKTVQNLLVTGRCISSTHEAQSSYRIMPICCCLGQAAGTAAALAKKNSTTLRTLDIKALRAELKKDGLKID